MSYRRSQFAEKCGVNKDDFARTSNEKIYAAGDVTLGPQFVYVAAYEGGIVADNVGM
jgi:pyruvate/2-oxoglutarate dehydrogenase complex dihydrolipoamide dehydrogenase (E3) component